MNRILLLTLAVIFALPATASACSGKKPYRWCGKQHSAAYNKRVFDKVAKEQGASKADAALLKRYIIKPESGWDNTANNGAGCKGLGQHLTKQPKRKWANPWWASRRTFSYIEERYNGSVSRALRFRRNNGWY